MAKKKNNITWTNERRKLSDLIPWERNPRTIKNAQAERLVDSVETFGQVVSKYGNAVLYKNYLEICQEMLQEKASQRGYTLTRWAGYYCGYMDQMTHYCGLFTRDAD